MKHIAIIGSGVSGLTAAYLLAKKHQVSVFEKASAIGGHTATVDVEVDNTWYAIDTGFIVFNNKTYPNYYIIRIRGWSITAITLIAYLHSVVIFSTRNFGY